MTDHNLTLTEVAREYDVEPARILGDERVGRVVTARKELIWRLHQDGMPHVAIADWLNRSVSYINASIRYRVLRQGLVDELNPLTQAERRQNEIKRLLGTGISLHEIAKQTGYEYGSLRTVLYRMRKRGEV